jgi:hypothetical protein
MYLGIDPYPYVYHSQSWVVYDILWYCFTHMNMLMHLHIIIEIKWGSAHPKFNPWNLVWKMVFLFDQNAVGLHIEFTACNGIWYTIQCDLGLGQRNWLSQNMDGLILYQDWCSLWVQRWLYVSRDRWAWLWDLLFFHPNDLHPSNTLKPLTYCPLKPASANFNEGFPRLQRPFQNKSCKSRPHENHAHGDHPNIVYRTQTMIRFSCVFRHPNHDYLIVILYHLQ